MNRAGAGAIRVRGVRNRRVFARHGQHFAVGRLPNPDAPAREIQVVLNWFEELKAKVGN